VIAYNTRPECPHSNGSRFKQKKGKKQIALQCKHRATFVSSIATFSVAPFRLAISRKRERKKSCKACLLQPSRLGNPALVQAKPVHYRVGRNEHEKASAARS
jgi:hypothetical protein